MANIIEALVFLARQMDGSMVIGYGVRAATYVGLQTNATTY
jgi:hypothetical protein